MVGVNIHEFVKSLKAAKVFTQKQCLVIENIYIYFNDLKVYKVIVAINPLMKKKAKKLGFNTQYQTTFIDDVEIDVERDFIPEDRRSKQVNATKGKYIAIYNPNNSDYAIYHGEEDEIEQIRKLKRPTYAF